MLDIDLAVADAFSILSPEQTLLTSRSAGWEHIGLYHVRLLPKVCHEHRFRQHILLINLEREIGGARTIGSHSKHSTLNVGDVVFIPALTQTSVTSQQAAEKIGLWLDPGFVDKMAYETFGLTTIDWVAQFARSDSLIEHIGRSLLKALQRNYSGCQPYAAAFASAIAIHLIQNYTSPLPQTQDTAPVKAKLIEGLGRHQLTQALNYIYSHLEQPIRVTNIASELDISPYHFSRLFKQSMGLSPYQYVMQQRVEKARMLLRQRPELSIAEIALQCGFTHQSHLAKYFRQMTGTTPNNYRRQ